MKPSITTFNEKEFLNYARKDNLYKSVNTNFVMVKKGRIELQHASSKISLSEFCITPLQPDTEYHITEVSPDIELLNLVLTKKFLHELPLSFRQLYSFKVISKEWNQIYAVHEQEFNSMYRTIENIRFYQQTHTDNDNYGFQITEIFFIGFIFQMRKVISQNNYLLKSKRSRSQEILIEFLRLLSKHYKKERKVSFYAQKMMLTSRHLSSVLKKETKKTASQIISTHVLNSAESQLATTLKPIKEIAEDLNFSDVYSFSHFFKKHLNISPRQYRNNLPVKSYIQTSN